MDTHSVKLVLGESNISTRHAFVSMLRQKGFSDINHAANFTALQNILKSSSVDLLVCDTNLEAGCLSQLISDIRQDKIGKNPFMVIIGLVTKAESGIIRSLVNAGIDDILIKPVSGLNLEKHLHMLAHHRKKFLATENYFGPDRRKDTRADQKSHVGTFVVPNPLDQAGIKVTPFQVKQQIEKTKKMVNDQFIERYAAELELSTGHLELLQSNKKMDEIPLTLNKIARASMVLRSKLGMSGFTQAINLCSDLLQLSTDVKARSEQFSQENVHEIRQVNHKIQNIIFPVSKPQEKPTRPTPMPVKKKKTSPAVTHNEAVPDVASQEELLKHLKKHA
ncbi:hypothetical protein MTBPR1_30274 [Candidatus Terasakiella magnetica]|uniref:Response regulatory domain-containing protein n=1 Tax=Candidatus Terasakiella magnetica TaxID=1867952 RepID=A0A1C3RI63_9PROT|nr:response regulator [Candidatus Terasakiella magnetica]SCA56904.1 hypothetical protein MTBPR1_30274 [Candidatus Terasakiella magnetica]